MTGPMVLANPVGGGSDTAIPIFHNRPMRDEESSRAAGADIFIEVPFVEIIIPGSRDKVITPVEDAHKKRWPAQWQAFLDKKEVPVNGTPLAEWPAINPGARATLEANHVRTVEALAQLPEGNLAVFGPQILELKHRAQKWLDARGGWIEKEKSYLEEIAALKARVAELESAPKVERKKRTTKETV